MLCCSLASSKVHLAKYSQCTEIRSGNASHNAVITRHVTACETAMGVVNIYSLAREYRLTHVKKNYLNMGVKFLSTASRVENIFT
jgi:hypothetical protein